MMTEGQGGPSWWDAGEYKKMSGGMFEGTFEVDGVVLGSAVKWFEAGNMETSLSADRHQVVLTPLGVAMLRPPYGDTGPRILVPNGDAVPLSRHWNISASRVGGYSHGPLGHPGRNRARKIAIRLTVQRPELPAFIGLVTDVQIAELNRRLEELR